MVQRWLWSETYMMDIHNIKLCYIQGVATHKEIQDAGQDKSAVLGWVKLTIFRLIKVMA